MKNKTICETFKQQASRIAEELNRASHTGLGMQEETITDILLNRIQFDHEENFFTRKFGPKEEGTITGADWLWCVGEPGSWITFAVQAKVMSLKTRRINYLHYRKGEQYNLLINFCKQFSFIPKYCVYAQVSENDNLFSINVPGLKHVPLIDWSFSTISTKYIKHLNSIKDRHISSVLQFSIPWSYIFCKINDKTESIAARIAHNLETLYWDFETEYRLQHNQKIRSNFKQIIWENPQPLRLVTKNIPMSVLYLLTQTRFPSKVPISNVGIFSSSPVQQIIQRELLRIKDERSWKRYPETFDRSICRLKEQPISYLLPE